MAIKKSELYSSLWESCDLLRGGMDASQYKDYVLVLLFIKYVSDKYAGKKYTPITIPEGASFSDMIALKGKPDIGDQINKKIVGPLAAANKLSDMPDFNDTGKLGTGAEMVKRLTDLIAVFENPELDFSKNRADGDDILGDAYEYLMRHFATESGKSKGQFYTPAEVSRILAAVIGIGSAQTSANTTVYDPTCGSGSLLLKVGDSAPTAVTLYGQEKDSATSGLARMNMILHDSPMALIAQGNTLTDPKFKDGNGLKTFDFVVANPPFSDKRWSTGLDPFNDPYGRFDTFGVPPAKQGDYAYLLHIVRSLKSTGKGACILPHGVLFRGNAEAEIRRNLVRHGYIKGIIGLPANLFYGTGIPACIIVIDKENAQARKGIFMVDASHGFIKDGPKNRLREQDIHRIVDVFNRQDGSDLRYARMVGLAEIEKNDFNLNLPRYIDSSVAEDIQDIQGHLQGGIPLADVEALSDYWAVCPQLKDALFKPLREGYATPAVDKAAIKATIFQHPQFAAYLKDMGQHFDAWRAQAIPQLKALHKGFHPKQLIGELADGLLHHYEGKPLIDAYDVYQHLMDYWAETMQDDAYLLAADGWVAQTYRVVEKTKKGKGENAKVVEKDKGWTCDLIPKQYIVARYFAAEQMDVDETSAALEAASSALAELEEEHSGEECAFSGFDKISAAAVKERIKEIGKDEDAAEELAVLKQWQSLADKEAGLKKRLKTLEAELDAQAYAQYPKLTADEIKTLVVEDKWLSAFAATVSEELERVSQTLTSRVRDLASRYESPLPMLVDELAVLSARVEAHLRKMLTGKMRLPGFGAEWEVKRLGELGSTYGGLVGKSKDDFGHGVAQYVPFINVMANVVIDCEAFDTVDVGIGEAQNKVLKGDLLFNGSSETPEEVAMCALVDQEVENLFLNSFCFGFRMKTDAPANGLFMAYYMRGPIGRELIKSLAQGSTRYNLSKLALLDGELRLPGKDEQTAIAEVLSDMDAELAALEARREKTKLIKQGMMQELLTGKTRLV